MNYKLIDFTCQEHVNKGANSMTLYIKVNEFASVLHECANG